MSWPEAPVAAAVRSSLFPLAARYRGHLRRDGTVGEDRASYRGFAYTERHLQCLWFDARLRPADLRTQDGEAVEVEDPGVWNLEAGPDFLGAVVRVGPERRRLRGDVEIHIHPRDWQRHGHVRDSRYRRVCLHVTYFPGARKAEELPPGTLHVALRDSLVGKAAFSLEAIEVAAYPFAARATCPPCQALLRTWEAPAKHHVLDAAGQERMRRKAERLAARWEEAGPEQSLYEELMAGLGFQHNKAPFRRLAETVPLEALRAYVAQPLQAQALLLGVAGLLPENPGRAWDPESIAYLRLVWNAWWKMRERWQPHVLPPGLWRLTGRPANHPVRRLVAAAHLFTRPLPLGEGCRAWAQDSGCLARMEADLQAVSDPFWDRRTTWGGVRLARPAALVGPERAQALVVNAAVPFLAVAGMREALPAEVLQALPRESVNGLVRQTAFNLFGPHHPGSLYRTGLRRQGLLQIFHDYCLNDRSRCAACAFPGLLAAWHPEAS